MKCCLSLISRASKGCDAFFYIYWKGSPKSLLAIGCMSSFYLSDEGIPQKMASNSSIDLFLSVWQTFNANIIPVKFLQRYWASETVEVKTTVQV